MKRFLLFIFLPFVAFIAFSSSFSGSFAVSDRIVYSSTPVTSSAWTEIVSSAPAQLESATIFDSSGQTLQLGVGAAGHEIAQMLIPPGGGSFPLSIGAGSRVVIQAVSGTASSGEADINLFYK